MKATSKIANYENLTPEEKLKALEELELEEQKPQDNKLKDALNKASAEAAEYKRKYNATLSEQEREKIEREEKEKALEEKIKELEFEKNLSTVKAQFLNLGYDNDLADETAKAYLEGNTQTVFANQKKFLEQKEANLRKEIMQKTPTPPAGGGGNAITRESIMAIKDNDERLQAIEEHQDLFIKGD